MTTDTTTSAVLLGEPLPIELMNTVSVVRAQTQDAIDTDAGAAAWLNAVAHRLQTEGAIPLEPLDAEQVGPTAEHLRELRSALRHLATETTDDPRPAATTPSLTRAEAIAALNDRSQAWPQLSWPGEAGPTRTYDGPGTVQDLAVQFIAHQAVELFTGPNRDRLRPCMAPNCLLFFVKNHSRREWCSPVCGNRVRVARHYRRHHPSESQN
ncbi:CGNR zinc finger domain-containing protein [Streptomyces sp. 049-1]|uniref:CGNR zinc finger domain-containing protein n=1 Tax=Streptomyces sp. 049-1 TaxID=2789264 RepID=UPI0039803D2C